MGCGRDTFMIKVILTHKILDPPREGQVLKYGPLELVVEHIGNSWPENESLRKTECLCYLQCNVLEAE